jgi:TRAP-type uncharacterized transport system substrate-binding protein
MRRRRRSSITIRDVILVVLGLAALSPALWLVWRGSSPKLIRLKMTAGRPEGSRHRVAQVLVEEAVAQGLRIKLRDTAGSEEALGLVNNKNFDVALVQGGLGLEGHANVRQVAALQVEPLHLLVRPELLRAVSKDLDALKGKTVNLSEVGSGTHALASAVMTFAGLSPDSEKSRGHYVPLTKSYAALESETDAARLPDAIFTVSTLPSSVVRHLVSKHHYRLVALPFGEAFALDSLFRERSANAPFEAVEKMRVYETLIPAFTYGVEPAVPSEPLRSLGTRLLVVAHKDVDVRAIHGLLQTIFATKFAEIARPPLAQTLLDLPQEGPLHAGTLAYLERNKPIIAGDVVDLVEKWVSIAGVVAGGLFFLLQGLRQRVRRLRDLGFESYIRKVTEVEKRAFELERAASLDLKALLELQSELGGIKSEALQRFSEGELEGTELMSSFLTHVSDTRDYLTRMILHERDNLEDQALAEGRSSQTLWDEALGGQ